MLIRVNFWSSNNRPPNNILVKFEGPCFFLCSYYRALLYSLNFVQAENIEIPKIVIINLKLDDGFAVVHLLGPRLRNMQSCPEVKTLTKFAATSRNVNSAFKKIVCK